ncbi:hypothetical protein [Salinigranum marinum]|uniref:hypothetical protein n=1 Tax=Salinigranum marinum TaxID=1515595 RepID=UPI002989EC7C|nr:hypothetical protein [Salinigranum marinum]
MSNRPTLAALLRGRSRAALVEFVRALHAARGAETRVDGSVVVVDGDRVLVVTGRRFAVLDGLGTRRATPSRIDRVVAVDTARAERIAARYDAHPVSAADLDGLARYGLDRAAADAVFREQFSRPVSAVEPVPTRADRDARRATHGRSSPTVLAGAVVVLVTLAMLGVVLSGAGVGATASPFPWASEAVDSVSVSVPLAPGSVAPDGEETSGGRAIGSGARTTLGSAGAAGPGEAGADRALAPGVSVDGVTDADALAAAHAAALGNRSYRWELSYVESVNGSVTARGTETVRVGSRRQFVSRVEWMGDPVGLTPVAARPSYADGAVRYRPSAADGEVVTRSLGDVPPAGEQGWRASRYLRWCLSARSSTVERTVVDTAPPVAVVTLNGSGDPNVAGYAARARVTADGFVRSLSVSYVLATRDGSPAVDVDVTFRYRVPADGSPAPPPWFTGARQRTG